jgi:hypothetical protein
MPAYTHPTYVGQWFQGAQNGTGSPTSTSRVVMVPASLKNTSALLFFGEGARERGKGRRFIPMGYCVDENKGELTSKDR